MAAKTANCVSNLPLHAAILYISSSLHPCTLQCGAIGLQLQQAAASSKAAQIAGTSTQR